MSKPRKPREKQVGYYTARVGIYGNATLARNADYWISISKPRTARAIADWLIRWADWRDGGEGED